jgi:hypothetical protein
MKFRKFVYEIDKWGPTKSFFLLFLFFFPCRHSSLTPFFLSFVLSLSILLAFTQTPLPFYFDFSFFTSDSLSVSYFLSIPTLPLFLLFSIESGQHSALLTAARGEVAGRATTPGDAHASRLAPVSPPWTGTNSLSGN